MIKEQSEFWYIPGDVTIITIESLNALLMRDGRKPFQINGVWVGGKDDIQRRTSIYYIYRHDNLINGR